MKYHDFYSYLISATNDTRNNKVKICNAEITVIILTYVVVRFVGGPFTVGNCAGIDVTTSFGVLPCGDTPYPNPLPGKRRSLCMSIFLVVVSIH